MTGAAILYVTSYSSKKTQKEERLAFEKLAGVLLKVIENQVRIIVLFGTICGDTVY